MCSGDILTGLRLQATLQRHAMSGMLRLQGAARTATRLKPPSAGVLTTHRRHLNNITVGIVRETTDGETRVAMVPGESRPTPSLCWPSPCRFHYSSTPRARCPAAVSLVGWRAFTLNFARRMSPPPRGTLSAIPAAALLDEYPFQLSPLSWPVGGMWRGGGVTAARSFPASLGRVGFVSAVVVF
eukprot:COSAG05_NODE_6611_length_931_cov_1.019231_2_plen_184_part_00